MALITTVAIASFTFGLLWRDHQLASSRITYTDVYVVAELGENKWLMQPARMQPIDSTLCHSHVDWKPGETLKDWTFEQMKGCKRVISYHRYHYAQGEVHAGY